MSGKKRVLILTTTAAPYRVELFNELGRYCELTVYFEQKNEATRHSDWFQDKFKYFNGSFLKKSDKDLGEIKFDFIKYLNRKAYDAVIFYEYSTITSISSIFVSILLGIPYFLNCDGGFPEESTWFKKMIKTFLVTRAKGYFAGGIYAKKYLMYYGAKEDKITIHNFTTLYQADIIKHPLSISEKQTLRKSLNLRGKKIAIAVGRFIELKNFHILIQAWAKTSEDFELLIIGGGEKKQEYDQLIDKLKLNNIRIIDFMKKSELFKYYTAADLFILPTSSDVWGLVVNEAMACGLPVITTDKCIAGLELIVDNENGFIVPVANVNEMSMKINEILKNEKLQEKMAQNNLNKINNFTYEYSTNAHLKNIYSNI
jgi:glycosyltransferase involved in cell wall biosynthesis